MNKPTVWVGLLCLLLGAGAGYFMFGGGDAQQAAAPVAAEKQPLFYRNPMNPAITSPVPAQDSMGMDYIPVYADDGTDAIVGTVRIDPVVQQNLGVRTAQAERRSLARMIRAVGRVDYDESRVTRLHPKVEGWIKEIWIDKTGQLVDDDAILLSIYSPKLVATQQEYLLALNNRETLRNSEFADIREGADALVRSSRERLSLMDVPEHQIVELEQSGVVKEELHIHAPAGGTVMRIGARKGQYVTPATELYEIVDLRRVWVYADVYESDLPWIRNGDHADIRISGQRDKNFSAQLDYIYPYADAKTRTTRIRLVLDNPGLLLRPETFAEVTIHADEQSNLVVVPAEAVIRSGERPLVFVMVEEGVLEPRPVTLGLESGEYVAVASGLEAGERVVVSAQFLIDSESRLREAAAKMQAPGSEDAAPSSMSGHEHHDMGHSMAPDVPMSGHEHHDMGHSAAPEKPMEMPAADEEAHHHHD